MDEPTASLDFKSRFFLLRHVRHLCADRGLAVLWATHLIEEDDNTEIVVLRAGRIVAQGPSRDIVADAGASRSLQDAFERLLRVPA